MSALGQGQTLSSCLALTRRSPKPKGWSFACVCAVKGRTGTLHEREREPPPISPTVRLNVSPDYRQCVERSCLRGDGPRRYGLQMAHWLAVAPPTRPKR